jgi:signal transduction histidine kinase
LRIRSQLAALMSAVIAPVALLAALATSGWYEAQRDVHSQVYLERVRALRVALDTEMQGTVRQLQTFAARPSLTSDGVPPPDEIDALRGMLQRSPMWSSITIVERDGTHTAHVGHEGVAAVEQMHGPTRANVLSAGQPAISDLISRPGGQHHYTFVTVPAMRSDQVMRFVVVGIHHANWLSFLRSYPILNDATLTLNDGAGRIIARTLNNEQWVGKMSRPEYVERIRVHNEGSLVNTGLEGQRFYSAFSRLNTVPWTLGTGVPAEVVEAPANRQVLLVTGGVLAAGLVAAGVALSLGRRITHAFSSLSDLVSKSDAERGRVAARPLPIDEADEVRRRLSDSLKAEAETVAAAGQARTQAESANKAKEEFVALVAHELRNPLSAMGLSLSLLESPHATPESNQRATKVLRRQLDQATMLVEDLLDTARLSTGQIALRPGDVDLAQVAGAVAQNFEEECKFRKLQLAVRVEQAVVHGDAARLEQVVSNLVHNAVKFSKPGGCISLQVGVAEGMATLRIEDDGIGIHADLLPRVFDPYRQAEPGLERKQSGIGLGLYLAQRLVTMHGGSIIAKSDGIGRGAMFEIRLPLRPDAAQLRADSIG